MNRVKTHTELMLMVLESVETLMADIRDKNVELQERDDYDEITQLHYTLRIIQKWFFNKGGLPV